MPHPVELMGSCISALRKWVESWAHNHPRKLRLGGFLITTALLLVSGFTGWLIERLALPGGALPQWLATPILVFSLASGLAARSLIKAVNGVLIALPEGNFQKDLLPARKKLSEIVGRDVKKLTEDEILRAAAETSSENAVDGIFAPLFWMFIGALIWQHDKSLPGPLTLTLIFKASSTLDSMIGYRHGQLRWLGTAGARLDDILTWIPCRLVVISLPLLNAPWTTIPMTIYTAWKEGSQDKSPNSGLSQAIFAYCSGIKMGGFNYYNENLIYKPILAAKSPKANRQGIQKLLTMILKLELFWISIMAILWYLI